MPLAENLVNDKWSFLIQQPFPKSGILSPNWQQRLPDQLTFAEIILLYLLIISLLSNLFLCH